MSEPPLHRLTPDGIAPVARMLAVAFHDDPGYAGLFEAQDRPAALRFLFSALLRLRLQAGATVWVAGTPEAPLGALSWTPSQIRFGFGDYLRAGLLFAPLKLGWTVTRRMQRADEEVGQLRRGCEPDVPHAWIAQVGVHPDHQGRGIGSSLLRATLEEVDATALPTALMTTLSANLGWYRRFGFEVAGERHVDAGFTTWFLVRPSGG